MKKSRTTCESVTCMLVVMLVVIMQIYAAILLEVAAINILGGVVREISGEYMAYFIFSGFMAGAFAIYLSGLIISNLKRQGGILNHVINAMIPVSIVYLIALISNLFDSESGSGYLSIFVIRIGSEVASGQVYLCLTMSILSIFSYMMLIRMTKRITIELRSW